VVWGRGGVMSNIFVRRGKATMALKYVDGDENDNDKIKTMPPSTTTSIFTTTMATHYAKVNKNSCHNVD
jgi:hypothetical protein